MKTSTITVKGQVTLPKEIREYLRVQKGDKVVFLKKGEDVIVRPAKQNILNFRGAVKTGKAIKDLMGVRKKVMEEVARRVALEGR